VQTAKILMKKVVVFLILFIAFFSVKSQLQIAQGNTVEWYVQNVLVGAGVTVTNVQFSGEDRQVGEFENGNTTNVGLNEGLIIGTGNVDLARGPNNNIVAADLVFTNNTPPDVDLATLLIGSAETDQLDVAILEFDFVPQGDRLSFGYVFGSEEYPEYVKADFNDVFGLFLSGPGIAGPFSDNAINIATLPGGGTVSIDNVNNGNPGFPAIGTDPAPPTNPAFFIDNGRGNTPAGTTIKYDGFTVPLKASATVIPCM